MVLLVFCGQTLVSHSQPPLPVDRTLLACLGKWSAGKGAGYARLARPLFHIGHYCFQYKLKMIMPWEKSVLAMLGYSSSWFPPFLNPLLLHWLQHWQMMTMTKTTIQLGGKVCILLQSTCATTYQVTTCVKQSVWSCKLAACSSKNFEKIIFVVEVKSMKTVKFIVLGTFPLYGTYNFSGNIDSNIYLVL